MIFGVISGVIHSLFIWNFSEYKIKSEAFDFTWKGLKKGLIFGIITGLVIGLIFGLTYWMIIRSIVGLQEGLFYGLVAGLIIGLIFGLNVEIKSREIPNQGIKQSFKKTVIIPCISILFSMVMLSFAFLYPDGASFISFSIFVAYSGLGVSLLIGGGDLNQHITLRLILEQQGLIPRNYAHFLDYAAERKLIHRIGGQYRFLHNSLRKHFVRQEHIPKRVIQINSQYRKWFAIPLLFAWFYIFLSILN